MGQISQAAAHEAATAITAPIQKEINDLVISIKKECGLVYEKHIHADIMKTFKNHPVCFKTRSSVNFNWNGFSNKSMKLDKEYPDMGYSFEPTKEEAKHILEIVAKKEKAEAMYETTFSEIENTLLSLGTHKRVEADFPEAFPYLPGINKNKGIIIAIQPIRNKVKKLVA